jgi:geranylgeranyl diphosphate synthase type I
MQKNRNDSNQEEIIERVEKLLKERGAKPLEMARKAILEEEIECKEVREALEYFMTKCWQDLARPTLLSLGCEAVGGNPEATAPFAVALSLISGGIDIHDDIIDQSKTKRSIPTVFGKFGKDIALLVGDALMFKGLTLMHEALKNQVSAEKAHEIMKIINRMFFELGDAEALELQLRGRIDVTPEEYIHIVKKKSADVEAHTRISAIIGGASEGEVEALANYGRLLGMILILRDDLLDMNDLKELSHRIKKECLPLPIIYALQFAENKAKMIPILGKRGKTRKNIKIIQQITMEAKGLERSEAIIREFVEKACKHLSKIKKPKDLLYFIKASVFPFSE